MTLLGFVPIKGDIERWSKKYDSSRKSRAGHSPTSPSTPQPLDYLLHSCSQDAYESMKPGTSLRSYLLNDGLTLTTRPKWMRSQHVAENVDPVIAERGHHIFIYNNIRTDQVIYSFTRTLNVRDTIKIGSSSA